MVKAEIVKVDAEDFKIKDDGFNLPYHIKWTCPECKTVHTERLDTYEYLIYPKINEPIIYNLYCSDCANEDRKCEWELKIRLNLSLDIV